MTPSQAARLSLMLPWPPKELSPNARVHWAALAPIKAGYREECGWRAKVGETDKGFLPQSMRPLPPPVRATVTFVVPDRRRRDVDNLMASVKAAWDGCVDAGLLEDDSADKFTPRPADPAFRVEKGERYVEVEFS